MINLKKISDNKYRLIIGDDDKDTAISKDIDWAEMARLFCMVAMEVCKHINKEE